MKFKALRTKKEPKEFVTFQTFGDETIMFTGALPECMPETATLEGLKEYWKKYSSLSDELSMDNIEMVEFEMFETNTLSVKLSPSLNLILMLETYFKETDKIKKKELEKIIKKEMKRSATCINYLSNLL
jgi:hypothetical protein